MARSAATEQLLTAAGVTVAASRVARSAEECRADRGRDRLACRDEGARSDAPSQNRSTSGEAAIERTRPRFVTRLPICTSALADRLEGVLVQRMVAAGVEMVAGGLNDPLLGAVIMAGTGGDLCRTRG